LTRIHTNALILGHSEETVTKKIDSLMYENIPGKIVWKKAITKNGFKGYDILNRTRKGDVQRYNIYVLPDEIVVLKISGIGEYVKDGSEADSFFMSVEFDKKLHEENAVNYAPPYGGFKASFPAYPVFIGEQDNDYDRNEWMAKDSKGNLFFIYKANINQFEYIEEDTFELRLMEESFTSSKIFKNSEPGVLGSWNKYPVINAAYIHSDGSLMKLRYLIQGTNYYIIGTKYKTDAAVADNFINSFELTAFDYGEVKEQKDTVLGFTVKSPLFYKEEKKDDDDFSMRDLYRQISDEDEDNENAESYMDLFQHFTAKSIGNDTAGEHILMVTFKLPAYTYIKDSAAFEKSRIMRNIAEDSDFIITSKKFYTTGNNWNCRDYVLTDTGSSRLGMVKYLYKGDRYFFLASMTDSITGGSYFVKNFFETFTPADTFPAFNPFEKKSALLFANYFGKDTAARKKAIAAISPGMFDSSDLRQVQKAISMLSWSDKKYLLLKKKWIEVIGNFHDTASADYLAELYTNVKDTSDLQNAILDAMLSMRTKYSFGRFKDLILSEPPALANTSSETGYDYRYNIQSMLNASLQDYDVTSNNNYYGSRWYPLYDTLQLAAGIIPGMLNLLTIDDYKDDVVDLLTTAVDSGYVTAEQYKSYFTKFLLEAKQLIKKRTAAEDKRKMNKLNNKKEDEDEYNEDDYDNYDYSYRYDNDASQNSLYNYAVLLLPFSDQSAEVAAYINKLLQLQDKKLRMDVITLLLRNKMPAPDSILTQLAKDDNYRTDLYLRLEKIKMTGKFPAAYKSQSSIAKSMLM
ncbi:MAG TPA: hypothetical protein PL045_09325, partial [Chitinophagaceae bacterium]|nr:hypothetical protein [Chitinophagaceae bacterium]